RIDGTWQEIGKKPRSLELVTFLNELEKE
ncbi:MAG: hypothetical protein ACJAVK_002456, partial [Akkermansiaceae bacterium]